MSRRPYAQLAMAPLYGVSHALFEIGYDICFRGEISGTENFNLSDGFIVASNHASFLDPPIVGLFVPRQIRFFARKSLWKRGFASWWLSGVGTIPIDREGGGDVSAIKRTLQTLEAGGVVLLFPEGTRSPDGGLQPPKSGVGMIACRSQVPVVPARIFGSFAAFGRGGRLKLGVPISMTYGRPLFPADYDDPSAGKERYDRAARRIMTAISELSEPRVPII